jgi:hypothetical protein
MQKSGARKMGSKNREKSSAEMHKMCKMQPRFLRLFPIFCGPKSQKREKITDFAACPCTGIDKIVGVPREPLFRISAFFFEPDVFPIQTREKRGYELGNFRSLCRPGFFQTLP